MSHLGRGHVLRARVDSDTYAASYYDPRGALDQYFAIPAAPYLKLAAVADAQGGLNVLALNRDLHSELAVDVSVRGFARLKVAQARQLRHDDLQACNTAAAPDEVAPAALNGVAVEGDRIRMTLPAASWNTVRLAPA